MIPSHRAEKLFDEASRLGLDGPTEDMVAEAIADAEYNIDMEHVCALQGVGLTSAADYLEKLALRRREEWK